MPDAEMTKFLEGVVGVVEADNYGKHMLWVENSRRDTPLTWVQNCHGYLLTIGMLDDMPVCISLFTAVIDGHKLLYLEATSTVVDHRMIDDWLKKNLPESAFQPGGEFVNSTDAMNFHNIFRYERDKARQATAA